MAEFIFLYITISGVKPADLQKLHRESRYLYFQLLFTNQKLKF